MNITCSACFGKGSQLLAAVLWQVNRINVGKLGEARIWEEQEQNQRYFHIEVKTPPWPPTQLQLKNSIEGNQSPSQFQQRAGLPELRSENSRCERRGFVAEVPMSGPEFPRLEKALAKTQEERAK